MIEFHELNDITEVVYKRKGKRYRPTSDTIYTYDIEVSSIYKLDGKWQEFDFSRPQKDYMNIEKCSVPYIWMFGINDDVYYGRHFFDIVSVFKKISDPVVRKVIWVHNLAYEFQFLRSIFNNYTIEGMVCRDALKPISFIVKELNLQFRCSYMLTNMNLDQASKEYGTVHKRTGTFDYNLLRGETTKLTKKEMLYCEDDCRSLKSVIEHYLHKWDHIVNIPLTSTSEVRRALRDELDFWYFKNTTWELVPPPEMYLKLMGTFAGGYTHSNFINTNIVLYDVTGYDIASSYPFALCCERYPVKPFKEYTFERYQTLKVRDSFAWLFEVTLTNIKSNFYNHYISYDKTYKRTGEIVTDNGRIVSCENGSISLWCTDVDLEIIQIAYDIEHIDYVQIYGAYKDYIDKRIIRFTLNMYKNKTELKGVSEKENLYKQSKAYINSLYPGWNECYKCA